MSQSIQLKFMKTIIDTYWTIQNYITDHTFIGIPLDMIAHFIVATLLTLVLLKLKLTIKRTFIIVFIVASIKECVDWKFQTRLTPSQLKLESIKDIIVTVSYPGIIWYIRSRKNRKS